MKTGLQQQRVVVTPTQTSILLKKKQRERERDKELTLVTKLPLSADYFRKESLALKEHILPDLFPAILSGWSKILYPLIFFIFCIFDIFYQTTQELSRKATFAVTPQKTGVKLGQLPAKDKVEVETTICTMPI